ncbi:MAG TPA: arylsulfatase [Bacteroidales bacterium]|nr:arylsulfatase [Bacteroidales bacterium]
MLFSIRKITLFLIVIIFSWSCSHEKAPGDNPNLVYILADDLGYGDISSCNPDSKIITPNIDMIASEGMMFTDAHSGSAVCTPTRYGILTGRYSWRTRLKQGVTWSWDRPLIDSSRLTIASMLKEKGYSTACIGKWHLGLGWLMDEEKGKADFSQALTAGPNDHGFDYSFIIPASLDIPPYVYIENHHITSQPDRITSDTSKFGWWREGDTGADFVHEKVLPYLTDKAVEWINSQAKKDKPFFLYFPLPAPHTPILPTAEFKGVSRTNPYGDFVVMVDHMVGRVMEAVKLNQIEDNTIIIFTSDNGCSPEADFEQLLGFGHSPGFIYRGHKADIFEGGHRVPFIMKWAGHINAGETSNNIVSLNDIMATMADITDYKLTANTAEDSYSMLPVLTGQHEKYGRESVIHHSVNGYFAIRKGKWKLNVCAGSGGWSHPTESEAEKMGLPWFQLYDLDNDPGERNNIAADYPEIVNELKGLLKIHILEGRSTPGSVQEFTPAENWPENKLKYELTSDNKKE